MVSAYRDPAFLKESFVYDMVVHAVRKPIETDLFRLDRAETSRAMSGHRREMAAHGVTGGMLALFDASALSWIGDGEEAPAFDLSMLALLDHPDPDEQIEGLVAAGVRSLMFHPYLQGIGRSDWERATALAQRADDAGLFTIVYTAFGSARIYDVEVLPFAAHLAASVAGPVVFGHAGGAKVLDAMLVACAWPNVLLETSFSLSYWMGSSVEGDTAFAMRKIGVDRCLFGSDAPFVPLAQALSDHEVFFRRHGFASGEIDAIMGGNAARLLEA